MNSERAVLKKQKCFFYVLKYIQFTCMIVKNCLTVKIDQFSSITTLPMALIEERSANMTWRWLKPVFTKPIRYVHLIKLWEHNQQRIE